MALAGLVVGLGNPGAEYAATRHNYGFIAMDYIISHFEQHGRFEKLSSSKDPYILWRGALPGEDSWLFMLPLAYMNRSGQSVQSVSAYYKITPEHIIVLHDELDLSLGAMKFKRGGGNAGHNGLKSLQQHLGTPEFARIRLGIGKPAGFDTSSFVLGRFSDTENTTVDAVCTAALDGLLLYMHDGDTQAQRFINSFILPKV